MASIKVGVIGAAGKMGSTVVETINAAPDTELVATADVSDNTGSVADFADAGVEVAVDFTHLEASRENLPVLAEAGIHAVVGSTGFDDADMASFGDAFTKSNCLIVPNFAISAVLMMRFAAEAAKHFETAEIIELHHNNKLDAPSGTAMATAAGMAEVNAEWADDPTQTMVADGARGGEGPGGIPIHSVRMRGMVAHQEVILGAEGQTLTIRQDSYDRTSFMPGVLLAVRKVAGLSGVSVGLDQLL